MANVARLLTETFSNVDAAWLHMDRPTSMITITAVYMFDERIDVERLKATMECRFLRYHRFRQRVREPALGIGLPVWETDPNFDLNAHFHHIALPAPGDQAALQRLVGDLMSTPFDYSKPLWQMHVVDNFGSGSAVITRLSHCIADGIALMEVLLSLTDKTADAPWPEPLPEPKSSRNPLADLLKPVVNVVGDTLDASEALVRGSVDTLLHPSRVLDAARLGAGATRALAKLVLLPADQNTLFRGKCGVTRRAAWTRQMPLTEVKAIGKCMGGTINDVLLTAVTGALRRYLEGWGVQTDGVEIRAMVPVNLRAPNEANKLGNRFGLIYVTLPVGVKDPAERLAIVKERMDAIKASPEAMVTFGILQATGMTPIQIEDIILKIFSVKATAVMTNVPGPRETLYLAGSPIRNIMFWVPSPAQLGLGVSIFSYAGSAIVGIQTDAGLVPDPETITENFHQEFDFMCDCLQVQSSAAVRAQRRTGRGEHAPSAAPSAPTAPAGNGHPAHAGFATCQATTRTGLPCKNRALPGQTTCYTHSRLAVPAAAEELI